MNGDQDDIVAVIPAFNEELAIAGVVLKTMDYVKKVIVVDDGSKDGTSRAASEAGAQVIRLEQNRGKAFALMKGFDEARTYDPSAVVMLDGDGQHLPDDIPTVVEPVLSGESDLVIGSRFLNNDQYMPKYRQAGQMMLNGFTNFGAKNKLTDTQSGFRALNKLALSSMDFNSVGYSIETDMIINFSSRGLRIQEVPVRVDNQVPNKHKKNSVVMGAQLLNNVISFVGYKRPLLMFGLVGLFFMLSGLTLGIATLSSSYIMGWSWLFQSILGGFLVIFGSVLIVSGLTLNSISYLVRSYEK